MIEKLDKKMEFVGISILGNKKAECLAFEAGRKLNKKINELVDAVNELQTRSENVQPDAESRSENVQDPTKWIGKLCKFWDLDEDYYYYGPLTKIGDISPYYYECNNRICYAHCEPVSEDLIYKGSDNE